jgi:uncharacterized protein (TIGR00290 family)
MPRPRALISWSSGKDSAWAFHQSTLGDEVDVVALLTTFNEEFDRVSMQGVRRELVEAQVEALGLPLRAVVLPWPCPNDVYEARMKEAMEAASDEGITRVVFGDLFLEDVRAYRIEKMEGTGIDPLFPIWGSDTGELARQMIEGGVRAVLTAVDTAQLPAGFAGRQFDLSLLEDLPAGVDPLGENGEFHTFCYSGPMFDREIRCDLGEIVDRGRFVYADVVPVRSGGFSRRR